MSGLTVPTAAAGSWWEATRRAVTLRPARPRWALAASVLPASALFTVSGALTGAWAQVGVANLAVIFAASLPKGSVRERLTTTLTQCLGAFVGIGVGELTHGSWWAGVAVPALVAAVAGAVGAIGPATTAAALMAVIGVAYTQFGASPLPGWRLCLWYGAGTLAMALPLLGQLVIQRPARDRQPAHGRIRRAVAVTTEPSARHAALRLGLCIAAASTLSLALHGENHAYWLPLTVAILIRPEYGSVVTRTMNRATGTFLGALLGVVVLAVVTDGLPVAVLAAVALSAGLLLGSYSYWINVAGVCTAALLSAYLSSPDGLYPVIRLQDTLLASAVALTLGYLIWPHQRRGLDITRTRPTVAAARAYLDARAHGGADPVGLRENASRHAHRLIATTRATLDEPPPAGTQAAALLPQAQELDRLIGQITALTGTPDPAEIERIRARLDQLYDGPQVSSTHHHSARSS